jgi:hypothetical protein
MPDRRDPGKFRPPTLALLAKPRRFAMLSAMLARGRCRASRNALIWPTMLLLCAALVPIAHADPGEGRGPTPQTFNVLACYQLAQNEGRMVAWARWEKRFPLEQTRSGQFGEGTPTWIVERIQAWIDDAYSWQVTDEQVQQWAVELGNTQDLPRASGLTVHQTIAIWMRRISRQCDSPQQVSAPESALARLHDESKDGR